MKGILEQLIRENDFLEDGLYHGYINLTSLATYLLPKIEKISGKKTTVPSITMTLSRIARDIQSAEYVRIRPEELLIRTNVNLVSFEHDMSLASELLTIYETLPHTHRADSYFSMAENSNEFSVIYSHDFAPRIAELSKSYEVKKSEENLALLVVRISERFFGEKGIIYYITKQLSFFGVSIVEMRTSLAEASILIHDKDKKTAISILG